jgi:hypothetical protein
MAQLIPLPAPIPPLSPRVLNATAALKFRLPIHLQAEGERKARWLTGSPLQFQSRWNSFVQQMAQTGGAVDPNVLVQYVLREAYLQTMEDLLFYAEKVKAFNAAKKQMRDHLQELRRYDQHMKQQQARAHLGLPPSVGMPATIAPSLVAQSELRQAIRKWEEKLNSLGEDAQLANVDLQNILQKQQQTLQMMANISKMLYDTAQSVIRKIGG